MACACGPLATAAATSPGRCLISCKTLPRSVHRGRRCRSSQWTTTCALSACRMPTLRGTARALSPRRSLRPHRCGHSMRASCAAGAGQDVFRRRRSTGVPLQVAGQQGAYIARIINRNHVHGIGGGDPPYMKVEANKAEHPEQTFDFLVRRSGASRNCASALGAGWVVGALIARAQAD